MPDISLTKTNPPPKGWILLRPGYATAIGWWHLNANCTYIGKIFGGEYAGHYLWELENGRQGIQSPMHVMCDPEPDDFVWRHYLEYLHKTDPDSLIYASASDHVYGRLQPHNNRRCNRTGEVFNQWICSRCLRILERRTHRSTLYYLTQLQFAQDAPVSQKRRIR